MGHLRNIMGQSKETRVFDNEVRGPFRALQSFPIQHVDGLGLGGAPTEMQQVHTLVARSKVATCEGPFGTARVHSRASFGLLVAFPPRLGSFPGQHFYEGVRFDCLGIPPVFWKREFGTIFLACLVTMHRRGYLKRNTAGMKVSRLMSSSRPGASPLPRTPGARQQRDSSISLLLALRILL